MIALSIFGSSRSVQAQSEDSALPESQMDALCLPHARLGEQVDCLIAGPMKVLHDQVRFGITFPAMPLPVKTIDSALADISYHYAKITTSPVPVYNHLPSDASEPATRYVTQAIMYISYQGTSESDAGLFYLSQNGEWIDGNNNCPGNCAIFSGRECCILSPVWIWLDC